MNSDASNAGPNSQIEPFYTIKDVAAWLNLPVFKIRRAVKAGAIPSYTFGNKRKLLRLSEVVAEIESSLTRTRNGVSPQSQGETR